MNQLPPALLLAGLVVGLSVAAAGQGGVPSGQAPRVAPSGPMPRPVAVVVPRGDREVEIDGSLLDWPELPVIDISDVRQVSGTAFGAYREPADLAAMAFVMWDADSLWFAAQVKDDWHRALDPQTLLVQETPVADSIVLSFDPRRDTRQLGPTPGRAEDVEFWLSEEATNSLMVWDRLRGSARVVEKETGGRIVVSNDKVHGITTYEARIPWREILLRDQIVGAGLVLDMQVVVNDFDEGTDPMPQTRLGWTFGSGLLVDPCLYGTLQLVDSADLEQAGVPPFPDRLDLPVPAEQTPEHWQQFRRRLAANPPVVHDGWRAPEVTGGFARYHLLAELEDAIDRLPRLDHVEFCQRVHRRMSREVAGFEQYGVPSFWAQQLRVVAKAAADAPPAGSLRLFKLPQNGWLLRGAEYNLLVDPAGANVEDYLWEASKLVILTQPIDMTRRNDQLLVRMVASKTDRRFLTHIAFHLPVVNMRDMPLMAPMSTHGAEGGLRVHALGNELADGSVPTVIGYEIEIPDGPRVLFAGAATQPEEITRRGCDVMVLSPRNPRALAVVEAADPKLIVIDDAFACSSRPNVPRATLDSLYAFQNALLPYESVLLAPGEHWQVDR